VNECDWHRRVNEAKTAMLRDEAWLLVTRVINYRIWKEFYEGATRKCKKFKCRSDV